MFILKYLKLEEITDRIRYMVEECDSISGVQLFSDSEGLFGGISPILLTTFKDDFSSSIPIYTFNLSSSRVC